MAAKISSPLLGALNNIVYFNKSRSAMKSTKTSFSDFVTFMDVETKRLQSIKLPKKRKIKDLQNLNVANTFGNAGSLLSSLASGALDVGGFIGSMFGRGKEKSPKAGKAIPKAKGFKLGGIRALGIANAAFAGLDFATGLAEGESVGQSAAGSGGALAGSLLGGAIGTALVPFPPLGFMLGSAVGGMAGGWLGDRAYEAATGQGKSVKEKTEERLKIQEQKQKEQSLVSKNTFASVINKFDQVVYNFENVFGGSMTTKSISSTTGEEQISKHEEIQPRKGGGGPVENPQDNDYNVTGGELPSKYINTPDYNEFRQYYNQGKGGKHQGEDYPIAQGTPISVVVPGRVEQASFSGAAGGNVLITHEDGKQTRYLHMSEISVSPGQQITAGQMIGKTGGQPGTTGAGRSTGPHLHFEFYQSTSGPPADPTAAADRYFRFGGNVTVKPKTKPKASGSTTASVPPKLTEQEFDKLKLDADIFDKLDEKMLGATSYKEYEKNYSVQNNLPIYKTEEKTQEAPVNIPIAQEPTIRYIQTVAASPSQISSYPSYDTQKTRLIIMPIAYGMGGGQQRPIVISAGQQQMTLPSGPSKGSMLNNVVKTLMLTNLSGS